MPAKSKQQLKLIWAIRNKYGSKSKAPKKWKWVFGEEWGHLAKESHIFNFNQFNEAMGTLSKDDTDIIEDLCLDFSEKWNLDFDFHKDKMYIYQYKGLISFIFNLVFKLIQRFLLIMVRLVDLRMKQSISKKTYQM